MAIDPQFLDEMPFVITLENVNGTSSGGYGARKYSAAVNVAARIEQFIYKAQSHEGKEVVTKGRIFTPPYDNSTGQVAITIRPPDRITIPAGLILGASNQPRIINVEQHNDELGGGGIMYYEVLV